MGGIPTDQVNEIYLMQNIKTSESLTEGSGMDELKRNIWILSMPKMLFQEANHMKKTGEQHAVMGDTRTSQDWEDTQFVGNILKDRSTFEYGKTFAIFQIEFIHIPLSMI